VHGYVPDNPSTPEKENEETYYRNGQVDRGEDDSDNTDWENPKNIEWH
jgi:hypothetical protein